MARNPGDYVSPRETNPFARFELKRSHLKTSIPGGAMNTGHYVATIPILSDEVRRGAMRTVAAHATDVDDARRLLVALGLMAPA